MEKVKKTLWKTEENVGSTVVSKASYLRVVKSWDCVEKDQLFTKQQIFRLVQVQISCRRQNRLNLKTKFCLRWVENIVGKAENAGHQHFLLFPQCFQKVSCF